jgi:hypothetical protein
MKKKGNRDEKQLERNDKVNAERVESETITN